MDTISRESNSSYLPIAGVLVGVLALIIAAAALFKANSVGKKVPDQLGERLTNVETSASAAASSADTAKANIQKLQSSVQGAFDQIGPEIANIKTSLTNLENAAKARAAAPKAGAKTGEPVVAGPGEYVVKPGDTGMKISKATGVSLADLEAANPGIDWKRLRVGQKIKTK